MTRFLDALTRILKIGWNIVVAFVITFIVFYGVVWLIVVKVYPEPPSVQYLGK